MSNLNGISKALIENFDYIINDYKIPESNVGFLSYGGILACSGAVAVAAIMPSPFVVLEGAVDALTNRNKKKISADDVPDDIVKIKNNEFYKLLIKYCKERGYTEQQLYKKACISKAVYSNVRNMGTGTKENYVPGKITVLALCIALKLTLKQTQEMLWLVGYSLSNNIRLDKIIAWCLEHTEYDCTVENINDVIYDKTGESPFIRYS